MWCWAHAHTHSYKHSDSSVHRVPFFRRFSTTIHPNDIFKLESVCSRDTCHCSRLRTIYVYFCMRAAIAGRLWLRLLRPFTNSVLYSSVQFSLFSVWIVCDIRGQLRKYWDCFLFVFRPLVLVDAVGFLFKGEATRENFFVNWTILQLMCVIINEQWCSRCYSHWTSECAVFRYLGCSPKDKLN